MSDPYVPPAVWSPDTVSGRVFAGINRPSAAPRTEAELPRGQHQLQLYTLATPNGQKASIMLEELLEAGHAAEYDGWTIEIGQGDQFSAGFIAVNPNGKIPALLDLRGPQPVRVFESGAILLHLADSFGAFGGRAATRAEVLSWLFWQVGAGPFMGGGFGHFYHYAPEKLEYPINRYAMEVKRLFDVADRRLQESRYLAGDEYTIADIASYPWLSAFVFGTAYGDAREFLSIQDYRAVDRWVREIADRPAVRRGGLVGRVTGPPEKQLRERHSPADFAGKDV